MELEKRCATLSGVQCDRRGLKVYSVATLNVEKFVKKLAMLLVKDVFRFSFTASANESNVRQLERYSIGVNRQYTVVVTD